VVCPCLVHHPEITGPTILIENTKIFAGTILVYHKIMKHSTFDRKVGMKICSKKDVFFTTHGGKYPPVFTQKSGTFDGVFDGICGRSLLGSVTWCPLVFQALSPYEISGQYL
jgi:hypothetical protein